MIVTGIGSRSAPDEVLSFIRTLPLKYDIVRSGGADGCDRAFEFTTDNLEIYVPWDKFNKRLDDTKHMNSRILLNHLPRSLIDTATSIAADIHPAFNSLGRGAKLLHTRNVFQVLGKNLLEEEKSDIVICWTPDGANTLDKCTSKTGGTGTAIKLACIFGIPVYNIYNEKDLDEICDILKLW